VPAAMLALSARYQNLAIKFGDVYIQALFEEIGLGILAACGINTAFTRVELHRDFRRLQLLRKWEP
jgi:hypothetical protein